MVQKHARKKIIPIDFSDVLERIGGDRSFLDELLALYFDEFSSKKANLKKAITQGNFQAVGEIGHSLKGSSANLGLGPLQRASCAVELAGKAKNREKAEEAVSHLEKEFENLKHYLEAEGQSL